MFLVGALMLVQAQPDRPRGDRYGDYDDRYYDRGSHHSYSYNTRGRGVDYSYYASIMNRADRKRLKRLTRLLRERERCAFEDGYLSRRERRRLNELRADIDNLIYRYRRADRYAYYNRRRPVCR